VTGGYVYRGSEVPGANGTYVFGDWCSRTIWGMSRDEDGRWRNTPVGESPFNIASFGEAEDGEIYIAGTNRFGRLAFSVSGSVETSTPTATATMTDVETSTPTATRPDPTATSTVGATNTPESAGATKLIPVALKQ
jgi:hypothetical protein